MSWSNPKRDELMRRYADRYTAAEFAKAWGTTRNAVLGRAFRMGLSLGKAPRTPKPRPLVRGKTPRISPAGRRYGRPLGGALPLRVKAAAVAALYAGATLDRASSLVSVSISTVWKWKRQPEVIAAATALYEMARADARRAASA